MAGRIPSGYGPNIAILDEIAFVTTAGEQITFPPGGAGLPFTEVQEGSVDAQTGTHILVTGAHGKVTVEPKMGRALEAKHAPGKHKEKLYDRGLKRAEIHISLTSWTQDGHDMLEQIVDLLALRALPKARKPIRAYYPTLAVLNVEWLVAKELVGFKPGELHGSMQLDVQFYEWNKEPRHKVPRQVVNVQEPNSVFEPNQSRVNSNTAAGRSDRNINFTPNTNP